MEFVGDGSGNRKRKGKEVVDSTGSIVKRREKITQSTTINEDLREEACKQIAMFFYNNGIPLSVLKSDEFLKICDLVAQYGTGFKPPSCDEIKGKYLKKKVAETNESIENIKATWRNTGCSILVDSWTNSRGMTICNFFVNSPRGTVFLKSVDASDICNSADSIFKMIDDIVDEVGEENVVQVVTKNEANYKAAGKMLMEKRKKLFWSPCAIHCIDLILEEFENKFKVHKETIANGKRITSYIYSRNSLIALLHRFTKGEDLIKPSVTKFATSYQTLDCLNRNKEALMGMFKSKQWKFSCFSRTASGKDVENVVMDSRFWENIVVCFKVANPLIKVLHFVVSDEKPAMGYIYKEINRAKQKIKCAFNGVKKRYMPLWDIIDEKWDTQLRRPLHGAAYYFNPQFHYSPDFKADVEVKYGLYGYLLRMVPHKDEQPKIDLQLEDFKLARNSFGRDTAKCALKTFAPGQWWDFFGFECPELQKVAVRILSLTCSSSGCESNRNAFDTVHTKRRNYLKQRMMNDALFVMSNSKLANRKQSKKAIEYSMDDLSSDDEWIVDNDGSSSNNDEEFELDNLDLIFSSENVIPGDQVGEDITGGGGSSDDLKIPDDDTELDAELDVSDKDGASEPTDDVDGDDMEDES